MKRTFIKSKMHRAKVTGADLNYVGSRSISPNLMEAEDRREAACVNVNHRANGESWRP